MAKSIKEVSLEIKELIFNNHQIDLEQYLTSLSEENFIRFDDLKELYNNLSLWKMNHDSLDIKSTNKKVWTVGEEKFIITFSELSLNESMQNHTRKPINIMLSELEQILDDRTERAISVKYYVLMQDTKFDRRKKEYREAGRGVRDLKSYREQSLLNTAIGTTDRADEPIEAVQEAKEEEIDLIEVMTSLISNIETVGVNINPLFTSLLKISQKAVEHSNIERVDELEDRVNYLNLELVKEKDKNEKLQREVGDLFREFGKLRGEVEYFDGLNSKQKLQQINHYNSKLKIMVDRFGGVIGVTARA